MKKKTETKTKMAKESVDSMVQENQAESMSSQMNEEEFDRYIDNIMADKSQEQEKTEVQPEVEEANKETLEIMREDINKLIKVMNGFINAVAPQIVAEQNKGLQPVEDNPELDIAKKAQMYDAIIEHKKRNEAIRKNLFHQEDELKKVYADFDLKRFYNTQPVFKSELDKTGSVYAAYLKLLAANPAFISDGGIKRSFLENGAMPNLSAGSITTSPAGLPDKEFDDYIRNILGQI